MQSAPGVAALRLKKELKMLYEEPPPGISAWAREENCHELEAGACEALGPFHCCCCCSQSDRRRPQ